MKKLIIESHAKQPFKYFCGLDFGRSNANEAGAESSLRVSKTEATGIFHVHGCAQYRCGWYAWVDG
jgi:hypothetical protein